MSSPEPRRGVAVLERARIASLRLKCGDGIRDEWDGVQDIAKDLLVLERGWREIAAAAHLVRHVPAPPLPGTDVSLNRRIREDARALVNFVGIRPVVPFMEPRVVPLEPVLR